MPAGKNKPTKGTEDGCWLGQVHVVQVRARTLTVDGSGAHAESS